MNQNYEKGRRKEYKLKKELEREGLIVLRTAGSHGFADLIAIDKSIRIIRFIQCKPDNFSETDKRKLEEENSEFINHIWTSKFEVI
jgi:Holliday junction resolvase